MTDFIALKKLRFSISLYLILADSDIIDHSDFLYRHGK